MRPRVPLVAVLVRTERAGRLAHEAFGDGVVRLRIVGLDRDRTHDDLGAVGPQQRDLLGRDLVGHHEDAPVAALRGDDGEADTRVARRRFDDRAARLEQAVALGGVDHRDRRTVFDAATGVRHLELRDDLAAQAIGDAPKADEGSVADQIEERVGDLWCIREIHHRQARYRR